MSLRGRWIVVPAVLVIAGAAAVLSLRRPPSSARQGGVYIGVHTDPNEGMRAALRQISVDASRNPKANSFWVSWSDSRLAWLHLDDEMDRLYLEYDRRRLRLEEGDNEESGGWDGVTVKMLEDASRTRDPFRAFARYGCQSWP